MDVFLQAIAQGMLVGSTYGIVALGMALIYSVSSVVNFSHGDFLSFSMFLCYALFAAFSLDPYLSIVVTLPAMMAIGAVVYHLLIRPVIGHHLLMIIQLTLGLTFVLQNGTLMIFGGEPVRVPSIVESKLILIGDVVMRLPLVIAFFACIVLAIALFVMLGRTDFGRSIRAVHQHPRAAALMGVNVGKIRMLVFAMGIGLQAIAASLLAPGTPLHPTMGLRYTVITLLVLVLGGMSNFLGILVAGLVIGLSEAVGTIYLSGISGMILPYAIFIAIMLVRPAGLLGART